MYHFETIFLRVCIILFLAGCATTQQERVSNLKLGMDKADVLDLLGSPLRSRYYNGVTTWTYAAKDRSSDKIQLQFKQQNLVQITDLQSAELDLHSVAEKSQNLKDYETKIEASRKLKIEGFEDLED